MKELIAALIVVSAMYFICNDAEASGLSEFYKEPDKVLHTQYSAIATNLMYVGGMSKWQAFTTMMMVGTAKELTDDNSTEEHHRDMLANMIGASTVFATDWMLDLHPNRANITYQKRF